MHENLWISGSFARWLIFSTLYQNKLADDGYVPVLRRSRISCTAASRNLSNSSLLLRSVFCTCLACGRTQWSESQFHVSFQRFLAFIPVLRFSSCELRAGLWGRNLPARPESQTLRIRLARRSANLTLFKTLFINSTPTRTRKIAK